MQSGGAFFERELSKGQERAARVLAVLVLVGVVCAVPFIVRSFQGLRLSSGDIEPWMPVGTPERKVYDRFSEIFQTHDTLLISWEGAEAEDARLLELAGLIEERDREQAKERGTPRLTVRVTALPVLLASFEGEMQGAEGFEEKIREAVRGYLTGRTGEPGLVVVEGTEHGLQNRLEMFELARAAAEEVLGEGGGELRYTGPCYLGVCANQETNKALRLVTPLTALISLAVAFLFLRSFLLAFLAFGVSGLAAASIITIMELSGRAFGEMLAVIPSLAQLLAMSSVMHLINYYLEFVLHKGDYRRAWLYAIHSGSGPTISASITTAIGFGSLYASNLPVVRDFALFGVVGVICSMVIVLLVMPAAMILLQPKVKEPWAVQQRLVEWLIRLSAGRKVILSVVLLGALLVALTGLPRLKSDVALESLFAADSAFRRDFDWFEERLGSLQSADIMVTFGDEGEMTGLAEQFDFVERLAGRLAEADSRYAVFSPALFREGVPEGYRGESAVLEGVLAHVQDEGWAWADATGDHWRISLRHPSEPDPADSPLRRHLGGIAEELLAEWGGETKRPEVELTGISQLFANSQGDLLGQLLRSFFLAFLAITPVVMVALRSVKLGAIAIVPNIFPLVMFFGMMGWAGLAVDIATMMIAAVAFGIAVDNTVHFLTWMERGLGVEHTLRRSVHFAFRNSAGAMIQTTLIISLGMMAFLLSDFRPSVRFALFSAVVLNIGLVGDLVLLPSMIQGIFSRMFRRFRGDPSFLE